MKSFVILAISVLFCFQLAGQNQGKLTSDDKKALRMPLDSIASTDGITNYIMTNFTGEEKRVRALYVILAHFLRYDNDLITSKNRPRYPKEFIEAALKTRKTNCVGYANVFRECAEKMGSQCEVIRGYNRMGKNASLIGHVWCAVWIDGKVYLCDPTYGGGILIGGRYIRAFSNDFYKTKPENMIKTNMPYDPMWQLLERPLTPAEFASKIKPQQAKSDYFNYNDTISHYFTLDRTGKLEDALRRVKNNGVENLLTSEFISGTERRIAYEKNNKLSGKLNGIYKIYNLGRNELTAFTKARGLKFDGKSDNEIINMITGAERFFQEASDSLKAVDFSETPQAVSDADNLAYMIGMANKAVTEQKAFAEKYCSTPEKKRLDLFYK